MYMIGRELHGDFEIQEQLDNGVALELKDVNIMKGEKAILDNINLTVNKGEILGIAGVDGNGRPSWRR